MHDAGKIIFGLIIFLALVTYPAWHNAISGKAGYIPTPKAPPDKKECIEPKQVIRVVHRDLLADWKESVVRKGMRTYLSGDMKTYTMSLTGTCMNCHKDKAEFCDQCHNYMGVKPRCWDCHVYPREVNLSSARPEGRDLPSTRAQAEGLKVHPEPRLPTRLERRGLARSNG
jgi:hypothetical protein